MQWWGPQRHNSRDRWIEWALENLIEWTGAQADRTKAVMRAYSLSLT